MSVSSEIFLLAKKIFNDRRFDRNKHELTLFTTEQKEGYDLVKCGDIGFYGGGFNLFYLTGNGQIVVVPIYTITSVSFSEELADGTNKSTKNKQTED